MIFYFAMENVVSNYAFKHGSRERRKCWDEIAEALNTLELPTLSVDQRAV